MERYVASKQLESLINIMSDGQDVICSKVSGVISLAVRINKETMSRYQTGDKLRWFSFCQNMFSEFPLIIASGDINK